MVAGTTVEDQRRDGHRYAAFISYSHAEDARVARGLRQALEGFGRSWIQSRRFRVWHDSASLAMTADLWTELQRALDSSDHLLVLLSPAVADSPWVERELRYFLERHSPEAVGFVVTGGPLPWGESPAPNPYERLLAPFSSLRPGAEPLWIDFRAFAPGLRASKRLPATAIEHIASIAARLEGKRKDDVYGDHLRALRRRVQIVVGAAFALTGLLLLAAAQMLREQTFKYDERGVQAAFLAARAGQETEAVARSILAVAWGLEHPFATALAQPEQMLDETLARWLGSAPGARSERVRPALMQGLIASTQAAWRGRRIARMRGLQNADFSRDGTQFLLAGRSGVEVRRTDGGLLWRTPESIEALWATFAGDRVVILSARRLEAWQDSKRSWSRVTDEEPFGMTRVIASGDGSHVLGVTQRELQLRDAATGVLEAVYPAPPSESIDVAALSRDARVLAFSTLASLVVIQRATGGAGSTWTERAVIEKSAVHALALSADGTKLATGHRDGTIEIWLPAPSGAPPQPLQKAAGAVPPSRHSEWVGCLDFSSDGRFLASGSADASAWVWDLERVRPVSASRGHAAYLRSVRFSNDGHTLLTSSEDDTVRIHPLFPKHRVLDLQPNAPGRFGSGDSSEMPPLRVRVSADGSQAALLDGLRRLWSWQLTPRPPVAAIVGHDVLDFAFGADQRLIAVDSIQTAAADTASVQSARARRGSRSRGWIAPHGERALTFDSEGHAVIIDPRTRVASSVLDPEPGNIHAASFSDDATSLVVLGAHALDVFDARTGRLSRHLRDSDDHRGFVHFSRDGQSLLARGQRGAVELWSPWSSARAAITLIDPGERREQRAAWAPDSLGLALADDRGTLSLATLGSNDRRILDRNLTGDTDLDFSSDGRLLAAAAGTTVTVWDLAFEAPLGRFQPGEAELATGIRDMSLSGDASKLVVLAEDGRAYLFNTDLASTFADACDLLPKDPEFSEALAACARHLP